jgi:hypothetical protein
LRYRYKKHYEKTGEIHDAVLGIETRGLETSLPHEIVVRLGEMLTNSIDPTHPEFRKKRQRELTQFHLSLEREFNQAINIQKIYYLVRTNRRWKRILKTTDAELINNAVIKPPSFFTPEDPGSLVFLDGVFGKFTINGEDGKPFRPSFLNIQDFGSRKILAGYFYTGETSANAVDIFIRFLISSPFVAKKMRFTPDQAGAFLNLKRVIPEINRLPQVRNSSFILVDDYAPPGTPKAKAPLESSHRAFQSYGAQIIQILVDAFPDREVVTYKAKQKKIGNRMEEELFPHLNVSLEELNTTKDPLTGLTIGQSYLKWHNERIHRFTEGEKVGVRWIPDSRWNPYLKAHSDNLIELHEQDLKICRLYGYDKEVRSITTDGIITINSTRYYVDDETIWNKQASTKVVVSIINDVQLAIFENDKEGCFLTCASILNETLKSEKAINYEKAKDIKRENKGLQANILKALTDTGIKYKNNELDQLIGIGLNPEVTREILKEQQQRYAKTAENSRFALFKKDVKNWFSGVKTTSKIMDSFMKRESFETQKNEDK